MPLDRDAMREYQKQRRERMKTIPAPHQTIPELGDEPKPVPRSGERGVVSRETTIGSMTQAERDAILRRIPNGTRGNGAQGLDATRRGYRSSVARRAV